MNEPSEKLMALIFKALDHGINSIEDGSGPLIPFVLTETTLDRFAAELLEVGLQEARNYVSKFDESVCEYAIAYDGFVTVENTKYDAIFVEAAERGNPSGFVYAQRYKPKKGFFGKFKTIGNTLFLGETDQLLGK
jgi:hypothetical protein